MSVRILCLCVFYVFGYVYGSEVDNQRLGSEYDDFQQEIKTLQLKEKNYEEQRSEDMDRFRRLEQMILTQHQTEQQQNDRIAELESSVKKLIENQSATQKRLLMDSELVGEEGVGFSMYLDHDLDGVGNKQVILFNQPLFNEGLHYSNITGIFTCPRAGVYMFIYFIGNRHAREVDAELVVNGVIQNEAVAEGVQSAHDTQGGNAAIIRLAQGDKVWVDTTLGSHVEGQWRFSSFSGALLYPA